VAQPPQSLRCPGCGQAFTADAKHSLPDGTWRCPACGKEFQPRKHPARAAPPPEATVFLPLCPICEEGAVVVAEATEEEQVYRCRACRSVLTETIFGFRYTRIDPRFEKRKDEFADQTFTAVELRKMSQQRLAARQAKARKAEPARPAAPQPKGGEELWWELDREELARRRKAAPKPARKDVTVDDLLDELKRKP